MRHLLMTIVALTLLMPMAGCGKKADPEPPPGTQSDYPRKYPRP